MSETPKFAFTKKNYMIMLLGIGLLIVGFYIMTIDKEPFGFGKLGLTIGPLIVMTGFIAQFVAIFYKDKTSNSEQ